MATAKLIPSQPAVTKIVTPAVEEQIVLTLTHAQARALRSVCGSVLWPSAKSSRRYTDEIYYALEDIGIKSLPKTEFEGGLRFTDTI
jgi:hypothetical protein